MDALYEFTSQPGIRRDGTNLDTPFYSDGIWVRWQRGRPRKIGGYRSMTQHANGPVRSVMLDSRGGVNSTHLFSQWGVQRVQFGNDGSSSNIEDRTPVGFSVNANLNWSHAAMYSSTGGAYTAIIAAATPDVLDIASDVSGGVYAGDIAGNAPLTQVSDGSGPIMTSGGLCVLQPFLFVYGSNGLIRNSNANDFSVATGWSGTYANQANPAGTKVLHGAPLRGGGQSPAGLFWSLDSLIRVSFVGGTSIWSYDTLASPTTVLSKKAIVEHDGKFFWPGTDRFLFYNGVVQELPNQMNCNYFFNNLNYAYQNKVWGVKVARWGEIWWFYPRGSDTECGNAVVFNYRENTWYDAVKERTAGAPTGVFQYPIWAGHEDSTDTQLLITGLNLITNNTTAIGNNTLHFASTAGVVDGMVISGNPGIPIGTTVLSHTGTTVVMSNNATILIASDATLSMTSMTISFAEGYVVTGGTSGATGVARRVLTNSINVSDVTGTFVSGETVTGISSATAVIQSATVSQQLVTQYQQEYGWDKIVGQEVSAVESSFTSRNIGFAIGDPFNDVPKTVDVMTRVTRLEPDFNQVGDLTLDVIGRSFASDTPQVIGTYNLKPGDSFQDMIDQDRILLIKITSNTQGGFYEQGQVMMKMEPGDERSTKAN